MGFTEEIEGLNFTSGNEGTEAMGLLVEKLSSVPPITFRPLHSFYSRNTFAAAVGPSSFLYTIFACTFL